MSQRFTLDQFPEAIAHLLDRIDALQAMVEHKELVTIKPVNTKQLCEFLNLTEQSIIRFRKNNIIPFYTIGSAVRYDLQKVIAALEKRKK